MGEEKCLRIKLKRGKWIVEKTKNLTFTGMIVKNAN